MRNKRLLKDFILFLKKENVYNEYLELLKKDYYYRKYSSYIKNQNEIIWLTETIKKRPQNLILDAFSWPCHHDSIDWSIIDTKWRAKILK